MSVMGYLFAVTLLWAFSFSLIGVYLAGQVDAWFSVLIRVALAALVFLPFLKKTPTPLACKLMLIGALQLGVMYGFYYHSFLFLSVPEVLLFTVMTPLYITLLNDALNKQFNPQFFIVAFIAVLGAITIRYENLDSNFLVGLLLVQGANISFAIGQVTYKRLMLNKQLDDKTVFGWFFIGALIVASACYALFGDLNKLPSTSTQWGILIYLGIVASGLGYFMWNKGATLVNVGALAVMNNLLIPAGIIVNVLIWNRDADLLRLSIGGGVMLVALVVNQIITKSAN
ncbi:MULTISPECIES: carboxylate/amino acid/amine transporter [Pseudoalteromonas]|jgi:carboxylate/amino acid/amine transporter|uniref:Membrane protein n=1 Tax=Pseudoalteromonas tetraodonis GFC TaxID=1315271 RepID=A0AA37W2Q5_9GAMM|nr:MULTISPECIES: carboxylate/amino acid/amine transporter [Pseudoalteromonas]PHQ94287.1 MAG: EamA family transporter [Pseudoalteromonas sp.]ADT67900.1 predicted inner membrane protein [Pseudoalteromonas sp. SM9913]MDN3394749.1 carboxylate/amino acid/amine transporter [Pseudoalteromonas sp. APC 3215]MDN3402870.1 carboxylate/amino acid/amine transporter [Pseudoalteromonas sp. APC 3213]MDN3430822.1 carboxylate/amino acid/amine transporter [Pseudoalteromonas sp. APC 3907]